MSLTEPKAKALVTRVLAQASFGDVRVHVRSEASGNARFAAGIPTTSGDIESLTITVTASTKDRRLATVRGNRTDDASLAALVKDAEALAELSPVLPEWVPPLGPVTPSSASAVDRKVSGLTAKERTAAVSDAIEVARAEGLEISGFLQHDDVADVYADRAGLFAYQRYTDVSLSCTCRTSDGTGSSKAGFVSHALAGLDGRALAERAVKVAIKSARPTALDPGRYTVVLSPDAVADLLAFLIGELSHRAASEGRSFFSAPGGKTRIGEPLFHESITLVSDPDDKDDPARKFSGGGVPQERVEWIAGGRLLALTADRYWAERSGVPVRPRPSSVRLAGGLKTQDELVAGVDRGVLVTRFWYNRMLEPRSILATGLTRDGTFLIEDGKITRPVNNFRYNESPVTLLKRVIASGKPVRAGLGPGGVWVVPPMVVEGFNFESVSPAV